MIFNIISIRRNFIVWLYNFIPFVLFRLTDCCEFARKRGSRINTVSLTEIWKDKIIKEGGENFVILLIDIGRYTNGVSSLEMPFSKMVLYVEKGVADIRSMVVAISGFVECFTEMRVSNLINQYDPGAVLSLSFIQEANYEKDEKK